MRTPRLTITADPATSIVWTDTTGVSLSLSFCDSCSARFKPVDEFCNAMAAILGHELTHYYHRHLERWIFDTRFLKNPDIDTAIQNRIAGMAGDEAGKYEEREADADAWGGFYATVAGYNIRNWPDVLDFIRELIGKRELAGYPRWIERRAVAIRLVEEICQKAPLFDIGNYLLLIGDYDGARRCFKEISDRFPFAEAYNNAGLACALQALSTIQPAEIRYAYPFELSSEIRNLPGDRRQSVAGGTPSFGALVREADSCFSLAIATNPEFVPAYVNRSCAFSLVGSVDSAYAYATRTINLTEEWQRSGDAKYEPHEHGAALIAGGIAELKRGSREEARVEFERASIEEYGLAQENIRLMSGGKKDTVKNSCCTVVPSDSEDLYGVWSTIGHFGDNCANIRTADSSVEVSTPGYPGRGNFEYYSIRTPGIVYDIIASSKFSKAQTLKGIKIGDSLSDVTACTRYGQPSAILVAGGTEYYKYAGGERIEGMVFLIRESVVKGWFIYGNH
jgi:tetratricopeptide (TPR) repeat protein